MALERSYPLDGPADAYGNSYPRAYCRVSELREEEAPSLREAYLEADDATRTEVRRLLTRQ